jgi:hypothetical protein
MRASTDCIAARSTGPLQSLFRVRLCKMSDTGVGGVADFAAMSGSISGHLMVSPMALFDVLRCFLTHSRNHTATVTVCDVCVHWQCVGKRCCAHAGF